MYEPIENEQAHPLSIADTPSTSAKETDENDIQMKAEKDAFQQSRNSCRELE